MRLHLGYRVEQWLQDEAKVHTAPRSRTVLRQMFPGRVFSYKKPWTASLETSD